MPICGVELEADDRAMMNGIHTQARRAYFRAPTGLYNKAQYKSLSGIGKEGISNPGRRFACPGLCHEAPLGQKTGSKKRRISKALHADAGTLRIVRDDSADVAYANVKR